MDMLAHQFDDVEQQREASTLGMWVFLTTEVLFFGALFLGYAIYRSTYTEAFVEASRHLDITLGAVNTAVLLCSSLTMAMAVHEAQAGHQKALIRFLGLTMLLGAAFLAIKFYEYYVKAHEGLIPGMHFTWTGKTPAQASLFFLFYFIMTGMHAVHMIVGLALMTLLIVLTKKGKFTPLYNTPVELSGLYWHFVDIVWVFLFPLLYLVDRSGGTAALTK
jgi:cytochrome c oxidase subunit 3